MVKVCFYFQVHQPYRLKRYSIFNIGNDHNYFNDESDTNLNNNRIIRKVSDKCYLPANKLMLKLLNEYPEFKISYSLSGVLMDQLEEFYPEVLQSFQELNDTKRVEFLSETYHHSLSFMYSLKEFKRQIDLHKEKIKTLFNQEPKVFRNTELIYNNVLAKFIENMGYEGIIAEGWDHYLKGRSPNFVYSPPHAKKIKLLLKNYKLSDDIAFRFSTQSWSEWPLTVEKYGQWVSSVNGNGECVNLFMDYETIGEHQWKETGIFDFLEKLPKEILKHPDNTFATPSELTKLQSKDTVDIPYLMSWADVERDTSAWLGNSMQQAALSKIYELEKKVKKTKDPQLLDSWRKLQTSDNFYYMCTKWFADGDVHKYFNPYNSPYEAFITYMNVLNDFNLQLKNQLLRKQQNI